MLSEWDLHLHLLVATLTTLAGQSEISAADVALRLPYLRCGGANT